MNVIIVSCLCDYFENFADSLYAADIYVAWTLFIVSDSNVLYVSFFSFICLYAYCFVAEFSENKDLYLLWMASKPPGDN